MRLSPLTYVRYYIRKQAVQQVYTGIYKGMRWPGPGYGDCYESKLLGIYEKEIYPVVLELALSGLQSLIVIGSAEGYHAIGLARLTGLSPVCYEADGTARSHLLSLSSINGVSADIREAFGPDTPLDTAPGLILMDIEGAEIDILTEERLKKWQSHHLIVEVHDDSIRQILTQRSVSCFHTSFVPVQSRTVDDYPMDIPLKRILRRWWRVPVQEWRSESIGWLILQPLHR